MASDGGAIIGEILAERGVKHLFTLCGGHISPILVGAEANGLRVVDVRDEASAVFAADAVARMTGIPGVAAVTAGPGVTNTITAVKNAQMAQSPIVIFGGAAATLLKGRGSLQDIDQLSVMESITKWSVSLKTVPSIGPMVKKALDVAREGVPGPVFVELPIDLLYAEDMVRDMFMKEVGAGGSKNLGSKALELYLRGHLYRQFNQPHASIVPPIRESLAPKPGNRNPHAKKVASLLANAERPARTHLVLPIGVTTKTLTAAMADPLNLAAVDDLQFQTGRRVQVTVASADAVLDGIEAHYGGDFAELIDHARGCELPDTPIEMSGVMHIGYRQLATERWVAAPGGRVGGPLRGS